MTTLQELSDAVPNGGTLTLNGTYELGEDPTVEYPWIIHESQSITITGKATINLHPSDLRHRAALCVRGSNVNLTGSVQVVGARAKGAPYDAAREAQHGIETQGASIVYSKWAVSNVLGNSYYFGPREDRWSSRIIMHEAVSREAGRQHVAAQAVEDLWIVGGYWNACGRSAFDAEPPGYAWGCKRLNWLGTTVHAPFTFLFSNKGQGGPDACSDITVSKVRALGQGAGIKVQSPDGVRRSRYRFLDITSDTEVHHESVLIQGVDDLVIRGLVQPMSGTAAPAIAPPVNCTGVVIA